MKLITLNTWGGRINEPLLDFIRKNKSKIDIFCFQEVFKGGVSDAHKDLSNTLNINHILYEQITEILDGYNNLFCSFHKNAYGIACFVKKDIEIIKEGSVVVYENNDFPNVLREDLDHTRKMQWIHIKKNNKEYTVMHTHGHWTGVNKSDTEDRIKQSEKIITFSDKIKTPKILCGDFNLRPDTISTSILEKSFKNLIKDYKVSSTRTSFYKKEERFADYIFTSEDIETLCFRVLPDEVSDHSALYIEYI